MHLFRKLVTQSKLCAEKVMLATQLCLRYLKCLLGFHCMHWTFYGIKQEARYSCRDCDYFEAPKSLRYRKPKSKKPKH